MRRCGVIVLIPLWFLFSNPLSTAQQNPNLEEGLKAYGSFHNGDIDSVSLLNGNLSVQIPLFSYPQRGGKLEASFSLNFNAKPWLVGKFSTPNSNPPLIYKQWTPGRNLGIGLEDQRVTVTRTRRVFADDFGQSAPIETISDLSIHTADGASHLLGSIGGNIYETVDISGIRYDQNTSTVVTRDGVRFHIGPFFDLVPARPVDNGSDTTTTHSEIAVPVSVQDPNGNLITETRPTNSKVLLAVTDTLNRVVYSQGAATAGDPNCLNPSTDSTVPVTFTAPNGTSSVVKFCSSRITIQTSFGLSGVREHGPVTGSLLTAVILPNPGGAAVPPRWLFSYDSFGNLTRVTFPTGGSITYQWTNISLPTLALDDTTVNRGVSTRTVNDGSNTFVTTYTYGGIASDGTITNTVTDAAGNDSVHVFSKIVANTVGYYETRSQFFSGTGGTRALLKTVDTQFSGNIFEKTAANVVPIVITTTFPNNKVSRITNTYDSGNTVQNDSNQTFPLVLGNLIEKSEFDFGVGAPGSLLRKTVNSYLGLTDLNYKNANLLDLVSANIICSPIVSGETADSECGSGQGLKKRARTDFSYDQYGISNQFGHSLALVSSGIGAPTHGAAASGNVRGNQTTVSRWRNLPTPATLTTSFSNLDTGMVNWMEDAQGHHTSFEYSPTFLGAYLTKTTNALGHFSTAVYDLNTGLLTSTTDVNGKITSFSGYDQLFRLGSKGLPDGGSIGFAYTDSPPNKVGVTALVTGTTNIVSEAEVDGLGRSRLTRLLSDPEGTTFSRVAYDGVGRQQTTWNPSRCNLDTNPTSCAGESTFGITTNVYDGLGRVTKIVPQDGNANFNNITTDFSNFPTVVVKDQQGKQRRSTSDALGRLIAVEEPAGSTPPTTGAINLTVSGNYQWTVTAGQSAAAGAGSVAISGARQTTWVDGGGGCDPVCGQQVQVWDSGRVSIRVNNVLKEVTYNRFVNITAAGVASALASAIHNDPSYPADAQANGSSVSIWARTTGAATNYSLSASSTTNDPNNFGAGSYTATPSGATLTGGHNAVPGSPTCDSGSVWVTVAGFSASTTYNGTWNGSSCTTTTSFTTMANALRDIYNNNLNSPVTASVTANGGNATLALTSKLAGEVSNYSYETGKSTNFPATFASASYGASPTGGSMSGGADGATLSTPAKTFYTYDTLGNLLKVEQQGTASTCDPNPPSGACRVRSFEYDSLSRLTKATNPESGEITYAYDDDGNLTSKTSPKPNLQSGTTTIVTNFNYDLLHRLTGKTYTGIAETAVTYTYDESGSHNGLTVENGKGRRTGMTDASGQTAWSYDEMGRVKAERRTIGTVTNTISYTYNKDGSLATITYPSGRVVTYATSGAGRALSVIDVFNNVKYATQATYTPAGALAGLRNGETAASSGIVTANGYNNRLQPVSLTATNPAGAAVLSLTYNFNWGNANNGNVLNILNNRNHNRDQSFSYDELNRLANAETTNSSLWANSYQYDAWGNLNKMLVYNGKPEAQHFDQMSNAKNQLIGYSYDIAGNLLNDGLSHAFNYDTENRVATAAGVTYTYDGDGKRVQKSTGTLYWTGMGNDPLVETDSAGNNPIEYLFFTSKRIARRDSDNSIHYYFSDHLGSADVITTASGTIEGESDYYPLGGERVVTAGSNKYKFTGKERDSETSCDYFIARHYCSSTGRFLQPDEFPGGPVDAFSPNDPYPSGPLPYADIGNPQSLNKYTYTYNNPLRYTDPNGHDAVDEVVDLLGGVVRGYSSSVSLGAVGSPQPTDSLSSRIGQVVGSGLAAVDGVETLDAGIKTGGLGVVGEGVSGGTSTTLAITGGLEIAVGTEMVIGASANLVRIVNTPMESRRQGEFTPSDRREAINDNAKANGGTNRCENCGRQVVSTPNQKGQTPPAKQLHVHHDPPISKGGGRHSKRKILCRECHVERHSKDK